MRCFVSVLALAFGLLACPSARGEQIAASRGGHQNLPKQAPNSQTDEQPSPGAQDKDASIRSSLGPIADPIGLRGSLEERGLSYSLEYVGEVLGNVSGGIRRGAAYEGRLEHQFDADLEKLAGWKGASLQATFYVIHGRGLSRDNLSNLLVISEIEALPSERLNEVWFEQALLDRRVKIRLGQLAADTDFIVSRRAELFINSTFGWPGITAANLPSGGPAYPFATPGIRVEVAPSSETAFLFGAYNGDPAGPARGSADPDPQRRNPHGTEFRLRDPALLIGEGAWSYGDAKDSASLPGTVKVGYWHHLGGFADNRIDTLGFSLADPASSGVARRYRGDDGIYAIVDQTLFRVPDTRDHGVNLFARVSGSPADRNPVDLYVDSGLVAKGMIPGRPDDVIGVSFAYAHYSSGLRALDRDSAVQSGVPGPFRSSETVFEVTYQAQIVPGFIIQPDFQYVFRPSGGIPDLRSSTGARIRDAAVLGLRTSIRY